MTLMLAGLNSNRRSIVGGLTMEARLGLEEPHLVRTLRGHRGAVTSVAFSPTKRQVVSGGMDSCVMLWQFGEAPLGRSLENSSRGEGGSKRRPTARAFRLVGHRGAVHCVRFSPDGREAASSSADGCVRLWEPNAMGASTELKGHSAGVRSVDYSPDGSMLLTASDDKTVKVWSLPSRKFACALGASPVDDLADATASPLARTSRGGGSGARAHANWVRSAKWAPDGRVAASCGDDKLVKLWDVEARRCARTFFDHEAPVRDVVFSYDGTCLVSAGEDRAINVWDARSYALLQHYTAHDKPVTALAIDIDGRYLASASADASLKLYDLRRGQLLYTLRGHKAALGCTSFAPNSSKGQLFASGGADRTVLVWRSHLDGLLDCNDDEIDRNPATRRREPLPPPPKAADRPPTQQPTAPAKAPKAAAQKQRPRGNPQPISATAPRHVDVVLEEFVADAAAGVEPPPVTDDGVRTNRSFPNLDHVTRKSDDVPEAVAATLDHIVGQLSVITSTLGMLEQRLSITENRVAALTFANAPQPTDENPSMITDVLAVE